jgi:protein RecA
MDAGLTKMHTVITQIQKLRGRHVIEAMKRQAVRLEKTASIIKSVKKEYGTEAVRLLVSGKDDGESHGPCISTGRFELDDWLTGIENEKTLAIMPHTGRGFPRGRIVEIFGPESSGKTTLTLHLIAACQQQGGLVGFVDAEHALDKRWARKIGVNTSELLISQPDYGEQGLEIAESLVKAKVDMVVIDSVAALVPRKEIIEGKAEPALQARMMSKALRKMATLAEKNGTLVIFINQIRMKIGVMFGNPETTTGGNALKFYSSFRIETRFGGQLKKRVGGKDRVYGILMKLNGVKNKVATPFRKTKVKLEFDRGFTEIGEDLKSA